MKKILALTILILSVFSLTACFQKGEPPIGDKVRLSEVYIEGGSRSEPPMTASTHREISLNSTINPRTRNIQASTSIPSSSYIFVPVAGSDGKDSVKLIIRVINPEDHDITRIFIKATDAEGGPVRMFIEEELATGDTNKIDIDEGRRGIRWNGSGGEIASYSVSLDDVKSINYVSLEIVKIIYINSETDTIERADLGDNTSRIVDIFMINTYFEIDYGIPGKNPSLDNGILKFNISYDDPLGIIERVEVKIFDVDTKETHVLTPIEKNEDGYFKRDIEIDINTIPDFPDTKAMKHAYLDVEIILNEEKDRLSGENLVFKQIFESAQFINSLNKRYGATGLVENNGEGTPIIIYDSEMTFHLAITDTNNGLEVYSSLRYLDNGHSVDLRGRNLEILIKDSETDDVLLNLGDIFINNITSLAQIEITWEKSDFITVKTKRELLKSLELEGKNVTIEVRLVDGEDRIKDLIIDKESTIRVNEQGYVYVETKNLQGK